MITVRQANSDAPVHIKAGIYGPSGAGKTCLGARAYINNPAGLIHIASERQAEPIVSTWNPEASVIFTPTFADVRLAYEYCARGFRTGFVHDPALNGTAVVWTQTDRKFVCETIVIDSASDIFRTLKAEVTAEESRKAQARHLQKSGTLDGFTGEDDLGLHGWEVVQTKMLGLLRAFRDLPCNLIAIYADDEREEKALGTVHRPLLQGRDLKSNTLGLFNLFGYAYRRQTSQAERDAGRPDIVREVAFHADDRYSTKGLDGLASVEQPDFRRWHAKFVAFQANLAEKRKAKLATEAMPIPTVESVPEVAVPESPAQSAPQPAPEGAIQESPNGSV